MRLEVVRAALVGGLLFTLVLYPVLMGTDYDSFPSSSYPMFARPRQLGPVTFAQMIGWTDAGRAVALPPATLGHDEVLQTLSTLEHTFGRGAAAADALCRDVAARVAGGARWRDVRRVDLGRRTVDAASYARAPSMTQGSFELLASCEVSR